MLPVCLILLCITFRFYYSGQRWSSRGRPWPRGHILKSLALASKVKSLALASRPQVLENWPVLGSRTAVFFALLKFCEALEKFFGKRFFLEAARKIFVKTFFFFFFLRSSTCACVLGLGLEHSCPWPRECLSSERLSLASVFFVSLASSLVSSTPPLIVVVPRQHSFEARRNIVEMASWCMGVGKGGQGGAMAPPGFSHTLSKSSQISKILPFLVVNTGSILIGPPLKIFLPTPLSWW